MKLYKYIPPERVDILENEKIVFTPPGRFKDPFEWRPELAGITARALLKDTVRQHPKELIPGAHKMSARQLKIARRTLLKNANERGILEKTRESFSKTVATRADKDFGVLCLSATENENLMWYHYADGHRGVVIEFDSEQQEFRSLGRLWRIEYVNTQPVYDHRVHNIDFFRFKPKYLEFEKEYRIIRPLKECVPVNGQDECMLYFWPLPRVCVQAVYFGHRISDGFRGRILRALQNASARKFDSVPGKENYKLSFQEFK